VRCSPPENTPPELLDYPRGREARARELSKELAKAGIKEICANGPIQVPGGHRVLGRGHAAVVLHARMEGVGDVAVKVRRADSKRDSLVLECVALKAAWPVAPRVYRCTDEFIIMDLVLGPSADEAARSVRGCGEALALIAKLAEAARWLDRVGVCHEELSDLRGHAFVVGEAVKFIDFESASLRYCCSVCKVMSWALYRSPLTASCPSLEGSKGVIKALLREYKSSPTKEAFLNLIRALKKSVLD